jgi:hypothetical protein
MSTSSNEEEIRALADAKADQKIGKQEFLNQIFGEVGTFIKGTMAFEALCMIVVSLAHFLALLQTTIASLAER